MHTISIRKSQIVSYDKCIGKNYKNHNQGRSHVVAWGGPSPGPCKKKFYQSRLKKNLGPPNIGQPAPPFPILNYSPKPSSNILPSPALVLGLITLCTPNKTSWPTQVQTLKPKLHFLFISKNPPTDPRNPFLYILFFCFVFLDTLSFAPVPLPTYQLQKLQSAVLIVRKRKKKKKKS